MTTPQASGAEAGAPPPPPKKGWPVLLILSLALNLFLVGLIGGAVLRGGQKAPPPGAMMPSGDLSPRTILSLVPPDRRADLQKIMRPYLSEIRQEMSAAARARSETFRILGAETYDRAAMEAAFARSRAADLAIAETSQKVVLDITDQMTDAERQAMVRKVRERIADRLRKEKERARSPQGFPPAAP